MFEGKNFVIFRILDLPIFNLIRLSIISHAKSVLRLFKMVFSDNSKYILKMLIRA